MQDVLTGNVPEVQLVDKSGQALGPEVLAALLAKCPELAQLSLRSTLYNNKEEGANSPEVIPKP